MAAAWAMPLDFNPARMLVVVDKNTHTRTLIDASGEFALCIPSREQARATLKVGTDSGRDEDKFQASGLSTFPASKIGAPLVAGCLGWLECKVLPEPHNQQAYDLFIGEVVAAWAAPDVFSGNRWHFLPRAAARSITWPAVRSSPPARAFPCPNRSRHERRAARRLSGRFRRVPAGRGGAWRAAQGAGRPTRF